MTNTSTLAAAITRNMDYDGRAIITHMDQTYRVRIVPDSDPESPREWCNVATLVCDHRRYNLGDYQDGHDKAATAIRASRDYRATWEDSPTGTFRHKGTVYDCLDLSHGPDLYIAMSLCSDIVMQPLYLYDHSGLTISTGRFSCPWDSGQVGFAFVSLATIRHETRWRTMCKPAVTWARRCIDAEVETYDSYLRGDVYGYIVEIAMEWEDESYNPRTGRRYPEPSEWEEIPDGSCWGYYGEAAESGLAEQAAAAIEYDARQRRTNRNTRLASLIRNRVPLHLRSAALQESVA